MSAVIAVSPIAPMLAEADVRAEQVTQLVLGDAAELLERSGEWRRVRAFEDGYVGWVHQGYLRETDTTTVAAWRERATAWSEGARVDLGGHVAPLPLGARVALGGDSVELPDSRRGRIVAGSVREHADVIAGAGRERPETWAWARFAGSPYQWGGRTPWGVDCSGLVQTTYAARGIALPRDSSKQVAAGAAVPLDGIEPGDLLFFRSETGTHITHIAFAAAEETLVHSTISCGGVVHEPWGPGTRAWPLRERLVAVRRIVDG